ncbi:hypothetical protein [Arthrobacter sp. U41]|uniref:hypothetical protein n=1 Tax=Arthrobacter sp. U41 TaxID=1849032 RepID=UPI0012F75A8E|nr:hypothetical protein [Arthrobacter sp. U41]
MVSKPRFVDRFMRATGHFRAVFGPADRGDSTTQVVHKHDEAELMSDEQISELEVERDEQGHTWVEDKKHTD